MCDKDHFAESVAEYEARGLVTRRQFGVLLAAGAAMMLPEAANAQATSEREVEIKTPDGTCDAYFVHPSSGAAAGVLIWPDIFGLRPAMRTMGKRLAGSGYSVLVVNPFYRAGKPTATGATPIKEMLAFRKGMSPATDMADAKTFVAWLDAQPQVNKNRKIGVQGYCMGGPMSFHTASAMPGRIGAVASFHGGGLVNDTAGPNSPHLLAPKIRARMYFGIATNDDMQQPDAKVKLKEAFDAAKNPADIEVYSMAQHGWCVPDMPAGANGPIYKKDDAEKAWAKLMALYKSALV